MTKNAKTWLCWSLGGVVLIAIVVCLYLRGGAPIEDPERESQNFKIRTPLVVLMEAPLVSAEEERVFTGFAKEEKTMKLSFRVAGPLLEFDPVVGLRVEEGTVLGKIDPRDFELAVARLEKGLEEANAMLSAMKTGAREEDVATLEANLKAAQSRYDEAEKNEQRFASLLKNGSVAQAQYDGVKMARDNALASRDAAQEQLKKAKTGARAEEIQAMEAKIAGLSVDLEMAQNALKDTELKAPCDGYVSQKYAEQGEIVAPGFPVLAFTKADSILIEAGIPESILVRRNDFTRFSCRFESLPGREFPAELKEIGLALQPGKQGYPLEVRVQLGDETSVHPGMAATLAIHIKREVAPCLIPFSAAVGDVRVSPTDVSEKMRAENDPENAIAIQEPIGTEETIVFVVDEKTMCAKAKNIRVVRKTQHGLEVEGLNPGEKIVRSGARFLTDGQRVRFQ
ncbi:MAG: efflux RND transporter periplasmic adaptor subunit [Planctomycetia bacterium]|nr:efflux RND transporter periplasmic adaptor subunit [Planctomycetia bacterium]